MRLRLQNGSVALVALCCIAVLGIALASYLAVSNQSMKLSNRAYAKDVSRHLAEMGLERALRSFTANTFSSWTHPDAITSTRSITIASSNYGSSGLTTAINLRVDNYNAYTQTSTWSASTSYVVNDLVGYNGIWYRCLRASTGNAPPDLRYWVESPIPWKWSSDITYAQYDVVNYNGTWYRCILAPTANQVPTNTTYWTYIPLISLSWSTNTSYPLGTMLFDSGTWYYCIQAHTSSGTITPTNATYWAAVITATGTLGTPTVPSNYYIGLSFAVGDYFYRPVDSLWYRCIQAGTYQSGDYNNSNPTGTLWVQNSIPNISWGWRNGVSYAFNSVVYYSSSGSGTWYRCIAAGATTPTTASWENALSASWAWSASTTYNLNNVVYSSGSFYRCIQSHTNQAPPNTTYWSTAPLLSPVWDSARSYNQYDTVTYNGAWYLSLQNSNLAQNPATITTYWALAPQSLAAWSATKAYALNDTVSYGGTWYRCIFAHTNQTPTNTTYWSSTTGAAYQWDATTAYTTSSYVSYGGVWYHCIGNNTNISPNNSTYWTALGAPVIYAEGVVTLPDGTAPVKTQLRATVMPAPLFPNALGATTLVSLPASGTIDSYDSALGTYNAIPSGFGSANIGSSAVIAGGSNASSAVTLTSMRVNGYVAAPSASSTPFAPAWSYGGTAILTSTPAPTAPSTNIDLTRVSRSPYIPQFDIQTVSGGTALPMTSGTLTSGTITIGTPGATTPSIYNVIGNLDRTAASDILKIVGPVIINVTGRLYVTSPGKIVISSTGSSEIHFASQLWIGSNDAVSGIQNLTLDPKKCILIGTSAANSAGSHYYWAQAPFYGVIYMPTAYLSTWTSVPIYGALSAKNIAFPQAGGAVHYDTSLRTAVISGVDAPYLISEWRELTDPAEKVTLP